MAMTEAERLAKANLAGVLWMLASCALLSGVSTLARFAALEGLHPFQIMFLRLAFALLAIAPLFLRRGRDLLHTTQPGLYAARVCVGLTAMATWFIALSMSTVGDVTAISFLTPLISTAGAVLFFSEAITLRRIGGLALGLVGALVILRPGVVEIGLGTWIALVATFAMASASLLIKRLTRTDDPDKVVFISTALQTPVALLPALFVWQWPEPYLWGVFVGMGILATLGQVALSRAFASADVGLVMGVDFARLPFAVLFGFALFGELIDLWTWIGAIVIFCATLISMRSGAGKRTWPRWLTFQRQRQP